MQKGVNEMATSRGKSFEGVVKEAFEKCKDVSVDRIPDQMNGFSGGSNICDFIVYRYPNQFYIECKSVHGNTISIYSNPKPDKNGVLHGYHGNISDTQWDGLVEKSRILGCCAGVLVWWVDKDVTKFIPIDVLETLYYEGHKSIRYDFEDEIQYNNKRFAITEIRGKKKRVYFDYDMEEFLNGF